VINDLINHIGEKGKRCFIDLLILHFLTIFPDSDIRYDVAGLLCSDYSLWSEITLIRMTFDCNELVRLNAIDSLCIGRTKLALKRLVKLSYSKNELIRSYCIMSIIDIVNNRNNAYEVRTYFHYIKKRLKKEKSDKVQLMANSSLYKSGEKSCINTILDVINKQINTDITDFFLIMNVIDDIIDNNNKNELKRLVKKISLKVRNKSYIERLQESKKKHRDIYNS